MSNWNPTPAQAAAVQDRGGSLLVSAAAGSGKTSVLAQRVLSLLCDSEHPVNADRLLIVTFTKAAAAELRARIENMLLDRLQHDPQNRKLLLQQQVRLQRANICTVDSFCLKLVQQHFQALDIPPDCVTADQADIGPLREEALAETLELCCAEPDFRAFADQFGKSRSDKMAGRAILQVYDHLRAMPHYLQRLNAYLEPWLAPGSFPGSEWQRFLSAEAQKKAHTSVLLFTKARQLIEEDQAEALAEADSPTARRTIQEQYAPFISRLTDAVHTAEQVELAADGAWDPLYALLAPFREGERPLPGIAGCKTRPKGSRLPVVRQLAKAGSECFEELLVLINCTTEQAEADRAAAAPLLTALAGAVRRFNEIYYQKKLEHKVLEFSDHEHLALQLLQNEDGSLTPLCASIQAGFQAVMVDEYQDTNALQDAIYRCLATPAADDLFFVGDLKQSIYRFRQAEPAIFQSKLAAYPPLPGGRPRPAPAKGQQGQNALVALDANFRSAPAVVDGINYLFEQLMTPELGGVVYGSGQRLVCGAPGAFTGSVEAHVLQTDDIALEADFVARRIRELVDAETPVRTGTGLRPLRYEDCCILMTTRTNFDLYANALAARGIPVFSDTSDNLFAAPHIRPLIALLQVIDNPAQDIPLAAAMLGPLFGFTEDDLVRLRVLCPGTTLYGAVLRVAALADQEPPPAPEALALARRVQAFAGQLTELRAIARSLPVEQLLEEILARCSYPALTGVLPGGAHRRDDVARFTAFCVQKGDAGLASLLRAIDAADQAGGYTDSTPARARAGCVTIMTIHRSKGLEFPLVVLADTSHLFNTGDMKGRLLLHREQGIGFALRVGLNGVYATASHKAVKQTQGRELVSEQMRLLYVALTRAKDHLLFTVPLPKISDSKKPPSIIKNTVVFHTAGAAQALHPRARAFHHWLFSALLVHPNGRPLREYASGGSSCGWVDTAAPIQITLHLEDELLAASENAGAAVPEDPPPADPALVRQLRAGFGWQYPHAALLSVPAKVSVTSVSHTQARMRLDRPAFMTATGITGAERGTAMHAFLEQADFAPFRAVYGQPHEVVLAAVEAERQRQLDRDLTTFALAGRLDTALLARFFESEVFGRLCAARQVLREYAFITALDPQAVLDAREGGTAAGQKLAEGMKDSGTAPDARVLVQGIADLVLVFDDHLELVDYKTDRNKTAAALAQEYAAQLDLYALALNKRFSPRTVTRKGIYSLELGQWIELP